MTEKRKKIIWLAVILSAGFLLRINGLCGRSLWTDEFFTLFQSSGHGLDIKKLLDNISATPGQAIMQAKDFKKFLEYDRARSVEDVTAGLIKTDTHPPGYFWIMHFWMRLFGDSIFTIRLFSVLMSMICVFLAYRLGCCLFDESAGIFSALFLSVSAFGVRYAQEARSYSLIMVIMMASWLFALRFEKHNKTTDLVVFAIFDSFGLLVHYFYIFVACAQFFYFSVVYKQKRELRYKLYLASLFSFLFFFSWFMLFVYKGYNFYLTEWIFGYPGLFDKVYYLLVNISHYLIIFSPSIVSIFLVSAGWVLFSYIAINNFKDAIARYPRQFFFSSVMFLVPILSILLIDIFEKGALLRQERFGVFAFAGFMPLAGYFLSRGFFRNKIVSCLGLLLILFSSLTVSRLQFGPAPKEASYWINKEALNGSSVVVVYNARSVVFSQAYYLNDDIYMLLVSDPEELKGGLSSLYKGMERVFIVRHYHRTDPSLMNPYFMEKDDIGLPFKLKATFNRDNISVSEFIKCAS